MSKILTFLPLVALAAVFLVIFKVLAARRPDSRAYRFALGLALASAFLLFWVNGAVGIIGSEGNDANMLYAGALAIGGAGAVIARFRPRGMALAMFATAFALVLIAAIALIAGWGSTGPIWPWDVMTATAFFVSLFIGSAWLFRRAGVTTSERGSVHSANPRERGNQ